MTRADTEPPFEPRGAPPGDDALAAELRGFGPAGILAVLVVLAGNLLFAPLSALLVLAWVRRSRTPWPKIGFARPRSWARDILLGVLLGVGLKLAMKSIVMPLLGAAPINAAYHHLVGNTAALPEMIYAVVVVAGFGEETVYRGFLFERLGKRFGSSAVTKAAIILGTSVLFGLAHVFEQGRDGVLQGFFVGIVFGTIFAATKRIGLPMIAHASFDLTALAIIYWDLERTVAHWFFE